MQLAIETLTDLGNHVVAELELGTVDWYSDIPELLYEAGYIDVDMQEQWIRMIGFRNTLVHDYLQIDRRTVYTALQERLADFETFRRVFAQFL